ncbi:MAG: cyclic nucleotide-binding domain-containing protein [Bacteroidetes bacterium]|nr:cyclic nucleotide-binding domain-containing protein [Bacteroidota bacterium]
MQKVHLECASCDAKSISFIKYCTPDQTDTINAAKSCVHYKKGQVIFYEDNLAQGVYCISSGVIKLVKSSEDGREQIIRFSQKGEFLGYRALIAEEPYVASAECVEDTVACFIPREAFLKVLAENPKVNSEMMRSLCHELGLADEKIASLAHKSVRERLAETLLLLHETFKMEQNMVHDDHMIHIVLPREDIANIVGTATETLIRLLSEFNKEGLIELKGKRIKLIEMRKLEKIAAMA